HGGRFSGFAIYNNDDGRYRGRIDLHDLSFARLVKGLAQLSKSAKNDLPKTPITGRVKGFVTIAGSAREPYGFGELSLSNSNIIPVPLIFRLNELLGASGQKITSFNQINLRFHMEGSSQGFDKIVIERGLLRSPTLEIECVGEI